MQQAQLRIKTREGKVYDIAEARASGWLVKIAPRKWQIIPYREAKEIPFDPSAAQAKKEKRASKSPSTP